jgi:ribosome biogenesis SPOUT family RNA methylase Rps3
MALKTLKDLKIRDEIYFIDGNNRVASVKITGITIDEIQFGNQGVFEYTQDDETCFVFDAKYRYDNGKTYYINKVTALKKRSSILNEDLRSLFERQKGVLEKIEDMTKSILETNLEIVNESN